MQAQYLTNEHVMFRDAVRQFVTRDRFEREGLIAPPGWRLRELSYFPGNARWLGDYLTHHELAIVHERVSA